MCIDHWCVTYVEIGEGLLYIHKREREGKKERKRKQKKQERKEKGKQQKEMK